MADEQEAVTQEWLDAHPDSALKIGDPIPTTAAVAKVKEPDLDKLRDQRCVPIARGILVDIATDLLTQVGDKKIEATTTVMKITQRALDADLNLVMENPYVFQLALKVYEGLNKTVQTCATAPIDDARYSAIAKKILDIVATANITITGIQAYEPTQEEAEKEWLPVRKQLDELFKANNLTWMEVKYIMDSTFSAINSVQNEFMTRMAISANAAEAKALGLEFFDDFSMKQVDELLKKQ